jgi:hypothetical protein
LKKGESAEIGPYAGRVEIVAGSNVFGELEERAVSFNDSSMAAASALSEESEPAFSKDAAIPRGTTIPIRLRMSLILKG